MTDYTQGVCKDGAVVLLNGRRLDVDEVIVELNGLSNRVDDLESVLIKIREAVAESLK